jgi:hypothetical protein
LQSLKTRLVFNRRNLELIRERLVDLLDVDTAILHWLDGVGSYLQVPCPGCARQHFVNSKTGKLLGKE